MRLQSVGGRPLNGSVGELSQLTELASGIDALYMSGHGQVSPRLLVDLAVAREQAEGSEEPVLFDLGGAVFEVAPRSWGRYPYRLQHRHGLLGLSDSASLPPVRIQPRAEFLHAVGPEAVVAWFREVVSGCTRELRLSASRIDLFADWQGWVLHPDDRLNFVTRAARRDTHEDEEVLTGFEFGRRTTKTVMARLYDKTLDVSMKGTDWWWDVWGPSCDRSRPVLRVEFEFGREGLRNYGIDSPRQALERAPALWAEATGRWLSHRVPTQDETRSRWPVSPQWQQIQHARLRAEAVGLRRVASGRKEGGLRLMLPALVGYLARAGAHLGANDFDGTMTALAPYVQQHERTSGVSFGDRVARKRRELGLA